MKHFCFVVKLNIELNYNSPNQKKVTNKILDQFSVLFQYPKADMGKPIQFLFKTPYSSQGPKPDPKTPRPNLSRLSTAQ